MWRHTKKLIYLMTINMMMKKVKIVESKIKEALEVAAVIMTLRKKMRTSWKMKVLRKVMLILTRSKMMIWLMKRLTRMN